MSSNIGEGSARNRSLSEKAIAEMRAQSREARKSGKRPAAEVGSSMNYRSLIFLFILMALGALPFAADAQSPVDADQVAVRLTEFPAGSVRHRFVPESNAVPAKVTKRSVRALEKYTFDLLNEERREKGLEPLKWNDSVAKVARMHSQNMAEQGFFRHSGTDGLMVDGRADEVGLGDWRAIGENIAFLRGYDDPAVFAVRQWMNSSGHKRNILNGQWTESGIGLAISENGSYYFTQVFLKRD